MSYRSSVKTNTISGYVSSISSTIGSCYSPQLTVTDLSNNQSVNNGGTLYPSTYNDQVIVNINVGIMFNLITITSPTGSSTTGLGNTVPVIGILNVYLNGTSKGSVTYSNGVMVRSPSNPNLYYYGVNYNITLNGSANATQQYSFKLDIYSQSGKLIVSCSNLQFSVNYSQATSTTTTPPPPPTTTTTTTTTTSTQPPSGIPGGYIPSGPSTTGDLGTSFLDELLLALASLGLMVPLMNTFASVQSNNIVPNAPTQQNPVSYANGYFYILLPNGQVATLPAQVVEQLAYYIQQNPQILQSIQQSQQQSQQQQNTQPSSNKPSGTS